MKIAIAAVVSVAAWLGLLAAAFSDDDWLVGVVYGVVTLVAFGALAGLVALWSWAL